MKLDGSQRVTVSPSAANAEEFVLVLVELDNEAVDRLGLDSLTALEHL